MKKLYRYELIYQSEDNFTNVELKEYETTRETNCYFFIPKNCYSKFTNTPQRKVMKGAYNSFAYDTKEKAKEHFIRRTKKRMSWFDYWKRECEEGLKIIEHL